MSLRIEIIKNSPVTSNCFVVSASDGDSCLIVDPGTCDNTSLLTYLEGENLCPQYVILTHEHFDHIGGVELLRKKYNIQLIASRACSEVIEFPKRNMSVFYDGVGFSVAGADLITEDIGCLNWEGYCLDFITCPGHTSGGICISLDDFLFSGDTMIYHLKTVTKLPGGDKEELIQTLKNLFSMFEPYKKVLPGHGEAFFFKDVKMEDFL